MHITASTGHDFEENLDAKEATLRALAEELADHDRQIETLQRKHCQEMDEVTRQKVRSISDAKMARNFILMFNLHRMQQST